MFYLILQLLRGASDNELRQFDLNKDPIKYHYMNQGSMDILNEKSDYKGTNNAFKTLGFASDEITTIWRTVAAILHLGNIEFQSEYEKQHLTLSKSTIKLCSSNNFNSYQIK